MHWMSTNKRLHSGDRPRANQDLQKLFLEAGNVLIVAVKKGSMGFSNDRLYMLIATPELNAY